MQQQWTISWSGCDVGWNVDFIWQPAMTSSAGPRSSFKVLSKAKLAPKRLWSLFRGLLPIWSTTAFWILVKPVHLRRCSANQWDALKTASCSRHWSTERAQLFSMTAPDHTSHNQPFKSWMNWATKFFLIHHTHLTSHQPTTAPSSISQLFAGKMHPQPAGDRKCFPRVHEITKHGFLHYRNKQTYFLSAKICWL